MSAKRQAAKIRELFGQRIANACAGTIVKPSFLAGLLDNECGKFDRRHPEVKAGRKEAGDFNENATRFEPGVYEDLISLRDRGFCFINGKRRTTYNSITREELKEASDEAIKALSRSFGATQIMGWSMVKMLPGTIADLRDPEKHLHLAVQRLIIVAGGYLEKGDELSLAKALRIWNTGSPTGKTYHASYVPNALAVMREYEKLPKLRARKDEPLAGMNDTQVVAEVVAGAPSAEEIDIDDELPPTTMSAEELDERAAAGEPLEEGIAGEAFFPGALAGGVGAAAGGAFPGIVERIRDVTGIAGGVGITLPEGVRDKLERAHEEIVEQAAPKKERSRKSLISGILAAAFGGGIPTIGGFAALYRFVTESNPAMLYALAIAVGLIFIAIAGAAVLIYWKYQDRQTRLDTLDREHAKEITLEKMRIASNPLLYNIKVKPGVTPADAPEDFSS